MAFFVAPRHGRVAAWAAFTRRAVSASATYDFAAARHVPRFVVIGRQCYTAGRTFLSGRKVGVQFVIGNSNIFCVGLFYEFVYYAPRGRRGR
eukprot:scaffold79067_cov34-Cyclotella_meneghiniana.AAC.1